MLMNSTTTQSTESSAPPPHAPAQRPPAAQKLEHARQRLRFALRSVSINEGRLLDFETAEELNRTLSAVYRDLEEVQITVAVMERRAHK